MSEFKQKRRRFTIFNNQNEAVKTDEVPEHARQTWYQYICFKFKKAKILNREVLCWDDEIIEE